MRLRLLKGAVADYRQIEIMVTTRSYEEPGEEPASTAPGKPKFSRKFRYVFAWQPKDGRYTAGKSEKLLDKRRLAVYKKLKPGSFGLN